MTSPLPPPTSFLSADAHTSEFLLEELKVLCEHSARKIVSVANVAKMLLAAEKYHAETLKNSCLSYVQKNMAEVCMFFCSFPPTIGLCCPAPQAPILHYD